MFSVAVEQVIASERKRPAMQPTKRMRRPTCPKTLHFLVKGLTTLGRKAIPQNNPEIPPPRWPIASVEAPPAMRLKIIMIMTIAISIHLTYSSCCPLNSYQLTQIIARSPNNIPKSEVDAPIDELIGSVLQEKRFPPNLQKTKEWKWKSVLLTRRRSRSQQCANIQP